MYLGHYTNLRSLELIIEGMQLKFSSLSKTNDPFENKNLLFKIIIRHKRGTLVTTSRQIEKENLKDYFKVICFTIENDIGKIIEKPRMWQQYSDMHRGCCLVFNKEKLDRQYKEITEQYEESTHRRVYYTLEKWKDKIRELIRNDNIDKILKEKGYQNKNVTDYIWKNRNLFIFSKMKDWETENEYRYCIYTNKSKNKEIFINIGDSIEEIILGEQVTNAYTKMLYNRFEDAKIIISKIEWVNGFPYKEIVKNVDETDYPSMEQTMQQEIRDAIKRSELK